MFGGIPLPAPFAVPGDRLWGEAHEVLGNLLLVVIGLHVLAALWHPVAQRDGTLTRMLPMLEPDGRASAGMVVRAGATGRDRACGARRDWIELMRSLLPGFGGSRRRFDSLSAQEILALAISSRRRTAGSTRFMRAACGSNTSADIFIAMAEEENGHRRRLIDLYLRRYGDLILPDPARTCRRLLRPASRSGWSESWRRRIREEAAAMGAMPGPSTPPPPPARRMPRSASCSATLKPPRRSMRNGRTTWWPTGLPGQRARRRYPSPSGNSC